MEADIDPYSDEERQTADTMLRECRDLLTRIAREQRRRARLRDTMQTSDLVQEAVLRTGARANWSSREHFVRAMALAMRHVIVDRARQKLTQKRGGGVADEAFEEDEVLPHYTETPEQLVAIGQILKELQATKPRWVRIIDARYFAGMTEEECADALDLSTRTVRREWREARQWLAEQLGVA